MAEFYRVSEATRRTSASFAFGSSARLDGGSDDDDDDRDNLLSLQFDAPLLPSGVAIDGGSDDGDQTDNNSDIHDYDIDDDIDDDDDDDELDEDEMYKAVFDDIESVPQLDGLNDKFAPPPPRSSRSKRSRTARVMLIFKKFVLFVFSNKTSPKIVCSFSCRDTSFKYRSKIQYN